MVYKLVGINSDTETCENCGKTGLKKVMWLDLLDEDGNTTGSVIAMGTTCGAKSLGFSRELSSVEQVSKAVEMRDKKDKAISQAKKQAKEFNDEIAVIRNDNVYYTVRGKAFDANPNRYNKPDLWVKP